MAAPAKTKLDAVMLDAIAGRVEQGLQVRRSLPPDGRIHIDRQLPFLLLYRPAPGAKDPGMRSLVSSQASYVVAPSDPATRRFTHDLVHRVASIQSDVFGGFLLIEMWEKPDPADDPDVLDDTRPEFEVAIPRQLEETPTVQALAAELAGVRVLGRSANVVVRPSVPLAPPGERRILTPAEARATNTHLVGIAAYAAWRATRTGEPYPLVRRAMTRQISRSLAKAAFVFASKETSSRPLHYHSLGRRAVVKAVHQIDRELAAVAESFDLLLTVTPINAEAAYRRFRRSRSDRPPRFQYRPHTVDPSLLKRKLFDIRIERVEDPTLEHLFREKRQELELKLSLIGDRLTPRFLPTSIALYGRVGDDAVDLARRVNEHLDGRERALRSRHVSGEEFAAAAEVELDSYRSIDPAITPQVELREDISSLMVSRGNLLVGRGVSIPFDRVEALLQHEVGTHVVTYWNGMAQPLRLLASGLARHDELQEGLGVFAEYLVGGLTVGRLRTLAARVIAARAVSDGAEFLDTYRMLTDDLGLIPRNAFMVAMRVHRGGGLVKDAIYLRGLQGVAEYVRRGGRVDTLLVGKIAPEHTAVVDELQRRHVLIVPPLRPNFLASPDSHARLERVRSGMDLFELADLD